jgi:hypothetical protein
LDEDIGAVDVGAVLFLGVAETEEEGLSVEAGGGEGAGGPHEGVL